MKPMPLDEEKRRVVELLQRYPYDPQAKPYEFASGAPERLRAVPPEYREFMAAIYVRNEARWRVEEQQTARRYAGKPEVL